VSPNWGRPWSERAAWGGLWLLSGLTPDWLASSEVWRLRTRFGGLGPESLALAVRRRAKVEYCRILPEYLDALTKEPATAARGLSVAGTAGADVVAMDLAEVYCDDQTRADLFTRFAILTTSNRPNLIVRTIRSIDLAQRLLAGRTDMPAAPVAMDLIESTDPRTAHAGYWW
jgi:hypothetical protein